MSSLAQTLQLLCVTIIMLTSVSSATADRIMRLADRQVIDFNRLVTETGSAGFIFMAENHTDARHHAAQLQLIKGLRSNGRSIVIGLEMFTTANQEKLDQWVTGKLPVEQFKEVYRSDWGVPWEYYRDILTYARDNRIRLYALNLPKEISRKVAREGFAALSPAERRLLPSEITCDVNPAYMYLLRQAFTNHAKDDKAFVHFCEAQVLWNRHMAKRMKTFQQENPGHVMVALVGTGHALKIGAPGEMGIDASGYRVILPEFPGLNRHNLTPQDTDYLLMFDDLFR